MVLAYSQSMMKEIDDQIRQSRRQYGHTLDRMA